MTRRLKNALLASTALAFAAVTVAACGSPSQNPPSKDSYGQTKESTNKTYASPAVVSTLPPAGSTMVYVPAQPTTGTMVLVPESNINTVRINTVGSTVLMPTDTVGSRVLVPTNTVGTRVLVPANTVGTRVLVPTTQIPASTMIANDVDFMAVASQFNATEIAMSRLAYQRAQSPAVRDFAQDVITTHRRMSDNLDAIALRRNVSLAWNPSPAGSQAVDRLAGLNGWDFDRYYLAQIIADHDAAVALYSGQGTVATDVTLRSTAGGDAAELRHRRDEAMRLQTHIN